MNWLAEPITANEQLEDICYFHLCYENSNTGGCVVNACINKTCIINL